VLAWLFVALCAVLVLATVGALVIMYVVLWQSWRAR
jgi:hypothetical protein